MDFVGGQRERERERERERVKKKREGDGDINCRWCTRNSSERLDKSLDGLVSLFNGISTLFRLFNAKAILLEEQ